MTLTYPTLQQMRDELRVGEEFLAKYNRPGPRYTSYPTAPVWNDGFGPTDLESAFEQAESAKTPVSLYMHIPFCESLCLFCACNVVIQKNKGVAPPYLDVLKRETERVSRSISKRRHVVNSIGAAGRQPISHRNKSRIFLNLLANISSSRPTVKSASKSIPV